MRAGVFRRSAAAAIDGAVGIMLALVFSSNLGFFFARRAVVTLRIDDPHSLWKGPIPLVLGAFGEVVYLLPFTLLIAWTLDPLTGATLGKRALGLSVRGAGGRAAATRQRWLRAVIQTVGLWGCTLSLLIGRWEIGAAAIGAQAVVLAGSLHDRIAGTSIAHVPRR